MPTDLFINGSDTSGQGLYTRANGTLAALTPFIVRNDIKPWRIHVMEESIAIALPQLRHRDITGTTLKVAIGQPDLGPTGGTFLMSYAGNSTGLTVLAYDITAAALETALNANGGVSGVGGVDVTGGPYQFIIKFRTVADKVEFVVDGANLEPASVASVQTTEPGTAGTHEEQVIRLLRRPYAYSDNWTPETADDEADVTLTSAGSATTKGVIDLALPENAESGSFRLDFSRIQAWAISVTSWFPATKQKFFLSITTPTNASDFSGVFWDVEDKDGPVRMWMDYNNSSTAPAIPAGGRRLELNYPNTTVAATIIAAMKVDLLADAEFSGTLSISSTQLLIVQTTGGTRVAPPPTVVGAFAATVTMSESEVGDNGELGGSHLTLADNAGTVAVWFNVHQDIEPEHGADRSIMVDASGFISAAQIRTGLSAAIDADSEFTSSVSGNKVLVTDISAGTRDAGELLNVTPLNTSRLPVGIVTAGAGISGEFPSDVTATDLEIFYGGFFVVTLTNPRQFRFVAIANGTWSLPTVASNFVVPTYFDGTLNLATTTLLAAFAATTEETLDAFLEVEHTTAGAVDTILRMPVIIYRDVLDSATIAPIELPTHLVGGDPIGLPDGNVGSLAWFFTADTDNGAYRIGANNWALVAGGVVVGAFSTTVVSFAEVPVKLSDGTVAAPSTHFESDINSGLYHISDGVIGVSCNGGNVASFTAGSGLSILGSKVVGARETGWSVPTATKARTTFATYGLSFSGTYDQADGDDLIVYVNSLGARLAALIEDLHGTAGHGLIGT